MANKSGSQNLSIPHIVTQPAPPPHINTTKPNQIKTLKNPILKINYSNSNLLEKAAHISGVESPKDRLLTNDFVKSNVPTTSSSALSNLRQQKKLEINQNNEIINKEFLMASENKSNYCNNSGDATTSSQSLALLKQKKKVEMISNLKSNFEKIHMAASEDVVNNNGNNNMKSFEVIIENARKSGQLNLSDKNLNEGLALNQNIL